LRSSAGKLRTVVSAIGDILRNLVRADVRFIVVGGVAVLLHGHLRATKDLDLVIDLAPEEARKAIAALMQMGLKPTLPVNAMDFTDEATRRGWIEDRNLVVFQMADPVDPRRNVDLFAEPPADFEELWARAVPINVDDVVVRIASVPDLIEMKRATGRALDLDDIVQLQKLEKKNHG
jgi:hypothetical protein